MNRTWDEEFWRLVLLLAVILLLNFLFDNFFVWLSIGLAIYLAWHLRQLNRLSEWIERRLTTEAPASSGIWEDIFLRLYRFRLRNKRRHKRLVKRLARFQEAAQAMPNAIIVMDHETTIEWCNSSATRMLGLHTRDDLGQRLLNLVRTPLLVNYIAREDYDEPLLMPSPVDEQKMLSVRMVPYGADQVLLVARDVTRMQRLEQVRRDFVSNVSHEMRTPLTVINGYMEMLLDEDNLSRKDSNEMLTLVNEQAIRLQSIVDDLLQLSRLEASSHVNVSETVAVPQLLGTIINDARELSGDQEHNFVTDIDSNLSLQGNEFEIRSAFSNLVFNAVRYTPAHGKITIRWFHDEQGACFSIRDSGIGIPAQHIPRLTERFYRVDVGRSRHTGGTGLGLAIVKHILQRHDASLFIESSLGVGSEFRCEFPRKMLVYNKS